MESLKIEGTLDTPRVIFDATIPKMEIAGKSFPPDVTFFYKPVLNWIDGYALNPNIETIFDLKLDYFNTASSKILLDILYKFEEMASSGNKVLIRWHYPDDDEDMEETGLEYERIVKIPFEHISYSVQFK